MFFHNVKNMTMAIIIQSTVAAVYILILVLSIYYKNYHKIMMPCSSILIIIGGIGSSSLYYLLFDCESNSRHYLILSLLFFINIGSILLRQRYLYTFVSIVPVIFAALGCYYFWNLNNGKHAWRKLCIDEGIVLF